MSIVDSIYNIYQYSSTATSIIMYTSNTYYYCSVIKNVYDITSCVGLGVSSLLFPKRITGNVIILHETDDVDDWLLIDI
jgi:hypothetical protein